MFVQSYRPCTGEKELRKNHIITEVSDSPPAHFDRVKLHFLLKTLVTKAAQEQRKLVLLKPPCPSSNPAAAPMLLLKFAHKNRRRWEAER